MTKAGHSRDKRGTKRAKGGKLDGGKRGKTGENLPRLTYEELEKVIQVINGLGRQYPRLISTLLTQQVPTSMGEIASCQPRMDFLVPAAQQAPAYALRFDITTTSCVFSLRHLLASLVDGMADVSLVWEDGRAQLELL